MKTPKVNQSLNISNPQTTYADVLAAVEAAPGLSHGVRGNMRSAVIRCSSLVGQQGLRAGVDLQLIAEHLEKLTPAKLGFTHPNSLAAFQSNLRRALRLGGITVMPGRHQEPLTAAWSAFDLGPLA